MLCKQFAFEAVLRRFAAMFFGFGIMYRAGKRKGETTKNCLASLCVCVSLLDKVSLIHQMATSSLIASSYTSLGRMPSKALIALPKPSAIASPSMVSSKPSLTKNFITLP